MSRPCPAFRAIGPGVLEHDVCRFCGWTAGGHQRRRLQPHVETLPSLEYVRRPGEEAGPGPVRAVALDPPRSNPAERVAVPGGGTVTFMSALSSLRVLVRRSHHAPAATMLSILERRAGTAALSPPAADSAVGAAVETWLDDPLLALARRIDATDRSAPSPRVHVGRTSVSRTEALHRLRGIVMSSRDPIAAGMLEILEARG